MKSFFLTLFFLSALVFADSLSNGPFFLVNPGIQAGGASADASNAYSAVIQPIGTIVTSLYSLCLGPFCDFLPSTPASCRIPPFLQSFGGATTNIASRLAANPFLSLKSVSNFVLERPGQFKIYFANPVDVCGVNFDGNVTSGNGFVSLNSANLPASISSPGRATVFLSNLVPAQSYSLKVVDGFPQSINDIVSNGVVCASSRCTGVFFAGRQAVFDVNGFSGFAVVPAFNPSVDPSVVPSVNPDNPTLDAGLLARCPSNLVVELNASVRVFNVNGGVPECAPTRIVSSVIGNGSVQNSELVYCDPIIGRHDFLVNTSESGLYAFSAVLDGRHTLCTFEVVGRAPTPSPELPLWVALLTFAVVFAVVRRKSRFV